MSNTMLAAWLSEYWLVATLVALALIGVTGWALRRGRNIDIAAPTLDDRVATPTLSRVVTPIATPAPVTPLAELAPEPTGHAAIPPAVGPAENLTKLKGIGPRLAKLLNQLGVLRYDQIAAWTPDDIAEINRHLGSFAGRIDKDRWVEQARLLAAHDIAGFEARFGKLDSEIA